MKYNAVVWDKTIASGDDGYQYDFDDHNTFINFLAEWTTDPTFSHAEIWIED